MAETWATSQWIQFFRRAGLPTNVAANYAIIFSDNRIQLNMLMDLSKEYLFDMGIKVMGDVIAILRHAKEFHNQLAKDKVMEDISVPSAVKKISPATRILGHYTRPVSNPTAPTLVENNSVQFTNRQLAQKPKVMLVKKKLDIVNAIHAKKTRRVRPEEEGAYKIKMPLGITERSRKILQQQKKIQQAVKGSVFARLGDSAVSSSTDVDKSKVSSVFSRLGPSSSHGNEVSTSSAFARQVSDTNSAFPLQYRGVLKGTSPVTRSFSSKLQSGILNKFVDTQIKKQIVKRLGPKPHSTAVAALSGVKRTVLNKSVRSTAGNVIQRKKLLSEEVALSTLSSTFQSRTGSQGILGANSAFTRMSVKSRLGNPTKSPYVQRVRAPEVVGISNRLGNVPLGRTVFQRLGQ